MSHFKGKKRSLPAANGSEFAPQQRKRRREDAADGDASHQLLQRKEDEDWLRSVLAHDGKAGEDDAVRAPIKRRVEKKTKSAAPKARDSEKKKRVAAVLASDDDAAEKTVSEHIKAPTKSERPPRKRRDAPRPPPPAPIPAETLAQAPPRGAKVRREFFLARKRLLKEQQAQPAAPPAAKSSATWFDGVDPVLVRAADAATRSRAELTAAAAPAMAEGARPGRGCLVETSSSERGPTRAVAIDCEFVGTGWQGRDNQLARVSIVNQFGHVLLDEWVSGRERVTDYRTDVSGVRPENLKGAPPFMEVHQRVADLVKGRLLVGHALHNDLKVLLLSHPRSKIRDTQKYKPFREAMGGGGRPGLRKLTERLLGVKIQEGEHSSVTDARATMRLYTLVKRRWEADLKSARVSSKKAAKAAADSDSDDEGRDPGRGKAAAAGLLSSSDEEDD